MSNLKEDTPIPDPAQPGSADLSTVLPPPGPAMKAGGVTVALSW